MQFIEIAKPSRPLEDEGSVSPRASKKRRTESGPEDIQVTPQPATAADQIPGNQIEQELASALGAGYVDSIERTDDDNVKDENSIENTAPQEPHPDIDPDMATVISNIMNHAERVEEHCAMGQRQLAECTDQTPPKLMFLKANSHLKAQSLPILDNLVRTSPIGNTPTIPFKCLLSSC